MTTCISTGEYALNIVLAFIIFCLGLLGFMAARKGKVRVFGVRKPETSKRFAQALVVIWWICGLLLLINTIFEGSC